MHSAVLVSSFVGRTTQLDKCMVSHRLNWTQVHTALRHTCAPRSFPVRRLAPWFVTNTLRRRLLCCSRRARQFLWQGAQLYLSNPYITCASCLDKNKRTERTHTIQEGNSIVLASSRRQTQPARGNDHTADRTAAAHRQPGGRGTSSAPCRRGTADCERVHRVITGALLLPTLASVTDNRSTYAS